MPSLLIDATYNSNLVILPGPDYIIDSTGSMIVGTDSGPVVLRAIFRFPMTTLPAGQTITLAQVRLTQWQNSNGSDRTQWYGPYHLVGLADPEADSGSTQNSRSDVTSTKYTTTSTHQSDGQKEVDITTGAASHIAASAGATYTVVVQQTDETTNATKLFKVYGQDQGGDIMAPDHVPQLYLEYSAPVAASSSGFAFWRWR